MNALTAARVSLLPALVGAALRLVAARLLPLTPRWDGYWYAALATELTHGDGYSSAGLPTAFWPPGLPAALAAVMSLGAPTVETATLTVNLVATGVAIFAAATLTDDIHIAKRSSFIIALYPGLVFWSLATMTETLTAALIVSSLALLRSDRKPLVALSGAITGLAALVRPPSILLVLVSLVAAPAQHRVLRFALCAGCALAVVAPWAIRNTMILDGFAFVSTNGGSNLYIGTDPLAQGGYRRPEVSRLCPRVHGEVARDRCLTQRAIERVEREPLEQINLGVKKFFRTVLTEVDPAAWHFGDSLGERSRVGAVLVGALCTVCWWLFVFSVVKGALRPEGIGALWPTVLALALFVGVHAVVIGADRYHLVWVPMLAPLAARATRRGGAQ